MGKDKRPKTNAMRLLEQQHVPHRVNFYDCDEFIDGVHVADALQQPHERSFKTLVTSAKSGAHYVFVLPIEEELDLKKAAKAVGEKNVELLHVKDIRAVTGYVRGGCTPIGMKKQFPTMLHESALNFEEIIISGGMLGAQIFLSPRDLASLLDATVTDIIKAKNE